MSARISGVKKEVAYGVSLVREFPVSQVKSPKAKGSALAALAVPPDFPFSVACPWVAITGFPELEIALAGATVAAVTAVAPGVVALFAGSVVPGVPGCETVVPGAAGWPALDSSSSTRLSSCSTRSSRYCSRSVSPGLGVSNLTGDVAPEGVPSSAKTSPGAIVTQRIVPRHNRANFIFQF